MPLLYIILKEQEPVKIPLYSSHMACKTLYIENFCQMCGLDHVF